MTKSHTTNVPHSSNAAEDGSVIGYMCLIAWEWELGAASDGNRIYPNEKSLRHHHPCADDCGIVEVEVRCRRLVSPGKDYGDGVSTP